MPRSTPDILRLALGVLVVGLCACSSAQRRDFSQAREFPTNLVRGEVLDVQVSRDVTILRATNTSARAFASPSTMWINRRFSLPIGDWGVGQSITVKLDTFRDNFGEQFRAGGFFARERPDTVVLVELETPTPDATGMQLIGLVVVRGKAE